jgi:hypothetical protein
MLEARDFTRINVFSGWRIWKLIWCGERRTELPDVTFSSTVKNVLFLLYPNRSGVPNELMFSILVHKILGVNAFHSFQNLLSGFKVTGLCYDRSYYWKQLLVVLPSFITAILHKWSDNFKININC